MLFHVLIFFLFSNQRKFFAASLNIQMWNIVLPVKETDSNIFSHKLHSNTSWLRKYCGCLFDRQKICFWSLVFLSHFEIGWSCKHVDVDRIKLLEIHKYICDTVYLLVLFRYGQKHIYFFFFRLGPRGEIRLHFYAKLMCRQKWRNTTSRKTDK